MKESGYDHWRIWFLSVIFFSALIGCSTSKKINKCGIVKNDYLTHYYNKCLQFKIVIMGDFKLQTHVTNKTEAIDSKIYSKPIALFTGLGKVGGVFHNYGYAVKHKDSIFYINNGYEHIVSGKINYYRKIDTVSFINEGRIKISYIIPVYKYDFLLEVQSWRSENDNISTKKLLEFAQYEHEPKIEEMQVGGDINFTDFISPFDLASDAFFSIKEGNYLAPLNRA